MKAGAAIIASACGYETLAIVSGRCPTITDVTRARPVPLRVVALSAFTGWLWLHMLRAAVEAKGA